MIVESYQNRMDKVCLTLPQPSEAMNNEHGTKSFVFIILKRQKSKIDFMEGKNNENKIFRRLSSLDYSPVCYWESKNSRRSQWNVALDWVR